MAQGEGNIVCLWVRSPLEEMKYLLTNVYFYFFALMSR